MPISAKAGSFQIGTGAVSSTVQVTGVGFTPTLVLLFWSGRTATGAGLTSHRRGFGAAVSSSSQWVVTSVSHDGPANVAAYRGHRNDACVSMLTGGTGASRGRASLASMDSDGFTLSIAVQFTEDNLLHYLALGGDLQASLGYFTATGTAPVTQTVSGIGFQPTGMLFASAGIQTNPSGTDNEASVIALGAASGPSNQGAWSGGNDNGFGDSISNAYNFSSECIAILNNNASGTNMRAEFSAFIGDGFSVNWLERALSSRVFYVALRGCRVHVGSLSTQTDTTTAITVSGLSFEPKAIVVASHGDVQSTQDTAQVNDQLSLGVATSPTNRTTMTTFDRNGPTFMEVSAAAANDAVYQRLDSTRAVVGAMDVQSINSDGATFIMDDADPSAAHAWYLMLGEESAAASRPPSLTLLGAG